MLLSPQILTRSRPAVVVAGGGGLGLQTSLTGFWSFESTSWTDDTGNGSTLTPAGTPASSNTAPALVGKYLALDGSSSLSCATNAHIESAGGSFSVQAWIYAPGFPGQAAFLNKDNNVFAQKEWGIGTAFTSAQHWQLVLYNTAGGQVSIESGSTCVSNTWTHVVATFNGSTNVGTIYVNGVADGVTSALGGTMQSGTSPFNVGISPSGTQNASGTNLDQIGFWKGRELSPTDVTNLYNSGAGLTFAGMA